MNGNNHSTTWPAWSNTDRFGDAQTTKGGTDVVLEFRPSVPCEPTKHAVRTECSCDIIHEEHVVVERVLELLEQACALIRHGEAPPRGFQRWAIGYFFQFADRCRHTKSVSARNPQLQSRGLSSDGGPVGVMLSDHKQGRTQILRMQDAVDRHDPTAWSLLAREYARLLRQQFQHENQLLRQMADVCGTHEDHADLSEIMRSTDRGQVGCEVDDRLDAQIEQWEQRFGVSAHPRASLKRPAREGSIERKAMPTSEAFRMDTAMPRMAGENRLAIVDCETDVAILKSLMCENTQRSEDSSETGRGSPRKSK